MGVFALGQMFEIDALGAAVDLGDIGFKGSIDDSGGWPFWTRRMKRRGPRRPLARRFSGGYCRFLQARRAVAKRCAVAKAAGYTGPVQVGAQVLGYPENFKFSGPFSFKENGTQPLAFQTICGFMSAGLIPATSTGVFIASRRNGSPNS